MKFTNQTIFSVTFTKIIMLSCFCVKYPWILNVSKCQGYFFIIDSTNEPQQFKNVWTLPGTAEYFI